MQPKPFDVLFEDWIEKQLTYQRSKKGRYLHFDRRFLLLNRNGNPNLKRISWLKRYFENAGPNIAKHAFHPFIKSDIITPRVKHLKDDKSKKKKPVLDKKVRPIAYASHFDSIVYSWYAHLLTDSYQSQLSHWKIDDCVLAYLSRDKQSNIDYANEVFGCISQKIQDEGSCVSLAYDLSSYFDNLDHDILKRQWCRVLNKSTLSKDHFKVFRTLTNYHFIQKSYLDIRFPIPLDKSHRIDRICEPHQFRQMIVDGQAIEKNSFVNPISTSKRHGKICGIPQGSPISACLSNIYLLDFDCLINAFARKKQAIYRRYCDDLLLVCSEKDAEFFDFLIKRSIVRSEVLLNEKKTEKVFFRKYGVTIKPSNAEGKRKHLQYLGFEYDGQNAYIRSSSMSRYHRRLSSKTFQTIEDAYCPEFGHGERIHRKKLYQKFTHLGKQNFVRYGLKAKKQMGDSKTIKSQIKGSIEKVERKLAEYRNAKESGLNHRGVEYRKMR